MNDQAKGAASPLTPRPARGCGDVSKNRLTTPTPL